MFNISLYKFFSIICIVSIFASCADQNSDTNQAALALLSQSNSGSSVDSPISNDIAPGDNALAKGKLTVNKYFGSSPFALNTTFTTDAGNTISIDLIQYWLSNVKFIRVDGTEVPLLDSYYFMTENNLQAADSNFYNTYPAKKREEVSIWIPYGEYKGVKFSVGVDPTYNGDLGRQAGELHETSRLLNVNWMWFSSYIFTRVRGNCSSCSGAKPFTLDTGADSSFRTITHNFESNVVVSKENHSPNFLLNFDVKKLFTGIDISTLTTSGGRRIIGATTPSQMTTLANNVAGSTSLVAATSETITEPNRVLVTLDIAKYFDSAEFQLGTTYTNSAGNQISFNSLRYYLSNLKFIKPDNSKVSVYNSYYAMQMHFAETGDGTYIPETVTWPARNREKVFVYIPSGNYTGLEFSIGVDPTYNDDMTKHAGELRLYNNLAQPNDWMWFTSYIFSSMKGSCSNCTNPKAFTLDTGANSSYRTITIPLAQTVTAASNTDLKIKIKLDVSRLFTGINVGTLSTNDFGERGISATTPTEMTNLSNNYQSAFSLLQVTSENR